MRGRRMLASSTALAALLLAGCAIGPHGERVPTTAGCARHPSGTAAVDRSGPPTPWPERRAEPPGTKNALSDQAVDPVAQAAYSLVSRTLAPVHGPYVLECIDLRTGLVREGPVFRAPYLVLASGYLWIYGGLGPRVSVSQVDPRSLRVIRSIHLPGTLPAAYPTIHLTAGPGRSVWIGSVRSGQAAALFRLDTGTGMVLTTARLPAKMAASDLADDQAREHLYVSTAHMVRGGMEGNAVLEYDARSGRLLAEADHGLVTYSVAGSALTAVPGGVWVSFRTGMLGLTLHLRQLDLATVAPPGPNIAQSPATSLFHWAMYAATSYGGGALWLANQAGIVACLDPRTGKPRAMERLRQGQLIFKLLAADPASGQVYASDNRGLVAMTPPPKCWQR
jgi:hypothetical protein